MKRSNRAMSWNAWDISTPLFPVLSVFWQKKQGVRSGKYLLNTPENAIS